MMFLPFVFFAGAAPPSETGRTPARKRKRKSSSSMAGGNMNNTGSGKKKSPGGFSMGSGDGVPTVSVVFIFVCWLVYYRFVERFSGKWYSICSGLMLHSD